MPVRLDQALVARGLARSRTHAARLIAEGKVSSDGKVLAKASLQVDEDRDLAVEHDEQDTYVSRAGHKLAGALDAFPGITADGKEVPGRRRLHRRLHRRPAAARRGARGGGRRRARPAGAAAPGAIPRVAVHEGLNVRYMVAGVTSAARPP